MFIKYAVILATCSLIVSSKIIVDNSDFTIWTIPDEVGADVSTVTTAGTGLIGGGSDCVPAFDWQISNANKGDFVILRASGTDAYNPFVYDLSVDANKTLNSVTTILFKNRQASYDATVQSLLTNAEAIFFAGGDQGNYIDFWAGTPVQTIAQEKLKTVTISGTSAGLAILGNWIYSATEGSVYSDESLENPYNKYITIAPALLKVPFMDTFITDTHFSARDRMGRLLAFTARISTDAPAPSPYAVRAMGIDEETALLLDNASGQVRTVGKNFAFICGASAAPAVCKQDAPLTFEGIKCTRLSAVLKETYNLGTRRGQGVDYVIDVQVGHYSNETTPYGPERH